MPYDKKINEMATASLLCNIFKDVYQKDGTEYCMICFRTLEDRRLVDGANVMKFKYFRQSNRLKSTDNTRYQKSLSENCLVCYMCDRQAAAAVKFCIAVNLSNKLHYMFSKMKLNESYKKEIFNILMRKGGRGKDEGTTDQDKEAKELEVIFNKIRNKYNLLQTETLTLGNDVKCEQEAPEEGQRGSCRDLLRFEAEEDPLAELTLTSQPDLMTKTILLDEDEFSNDEPHPIAIIHNAINNTQKDTDGQTDRQTPSLIITQQNKQNLIQNQTGMVLQPVILNINENNQSFAINSNNLSQNNQSIVIKSNNLSQNNQSFVINSNNLSQNNQSFVINSNNLSQNNQSFAINSNNLSQNTQSFPINNGTLTTINGQNFLINPVPIPVLNQYLNKDQFIPINNLNVNNQFILPVNQNNVLVPQNQNSNIVMAQKANTNLPANQNNSLLVEKNAKTRKTLKKNQAEPVSNAVLVGLKRAIDKKCQGQGEGQGQVSAPTPVKSGKIDWEDKIPMDVISCVSNSDPAVQVASPSPLHNFVITDVKSISEMPPHTDVVDLC